MKYPDPAAVPVSMPAQELGHETAWGDRIETVRQRRGESVSSFAQSLGISRGRLRGWLTQTTEPRLQSALDACHVLGHTLDELAHPLVELPAESRAVALVIERFGLNLGATLRDRDVAGSTLADTISIKRMTVYDWLALRKTPRLSAVLVAAQYFGISMHELATGQRA